MSTEIDRLLTDALAEEKKASRAADEMQTNPRAEKVRDVAHIKRIISEVLTAAKPPEVQQWVDAGHRMKVLIEAPINVDGIVGKGVTVPQMEWLTRRWLDKELLGTQIYSLAKRQVTGRWEVADFRITEGTEGKHDLRVANKNVRAMDPQFDPEIMGALDFDGANMDGFSVVKVNTLQVAIVWIDSVNEAEIKYDKDGNEQTGPQVVVQAAAPQQVVMVDTAAIAAHVRAQMEAEKEKPLHWKQREKLEREAAEAAKKE